MAARSEAYGRGGERLLDQGLARLRRRQVERHVPGGGVVVDLGCGHRGELLASLAPRLREGIGFDVSVQKAPPAPNIRLQAARADSVLPLPDAVANLVTCLAVIEHVERPDLLLREARRILKPVGTFVATTPAPAAKPILELLSRLGLIDAGEIFDHKRYYSPATLRSALVAAGFDPRLVAVRRFELGLNLAVVARVAVSGETARGLAPAAP